MMYTNQNKSINGSKSTQPSDIPKEQLTFPNFGIPPTIVSNVNSNDYVSSNTVNTVGDINNELLRLRTENQILQTEVNKLKEIISQLEQQLNRKSLEDEQYNNLLKKTISL